ncbi:MAG: GGDEF domain-containing protein [Spirochaetaceae bacterium]|jgi:diguanylate cyclase (GGDEF)-like protein|nr:GGDEF domain-containing protein [Spirochaetaceae bacterium]
MPAYYINATGTACLCIGIIFVDYFRKFNADRFQRRLFLWVLGSAFFAAVFFLAANAAEGLPGGAARAVVYGGNALFLICQNVSNFLLMVFLDYIIRGDYGRARKILRAAEVLLGLFVIAVILNGRFHWFFSVSPDNFYVRGPLYWFRIFFAYAPIFLVLVDAFLGRTLVSPAHVFMLLLLFLLSITGTSVDIILKKGGLLWSCLGAGLLYIYFFLVQSDLRIDPLTGIGNRLAFNEFMDKLSRRTRTHAYYLAMLDIDYFKGINDTLGHAEGDNALRDMALIIKSTTRRSDYVFRYGGDEFVIAVRAEYDIRRILTRIEEAIRNQNGLNMRPYKLSVSYGFDVYTADSPEPLTSFIDRIDRLMYAHKTAKAAGRADRLPGAG